MTWYLYKRGGWTIAVDAINSQDAASHIKINAPGAEYQGVYNPPRMQNASMTTAMVTTKREEQIRTNCRRLM